MVGGGRRRGGGGRRRGGESVRRSGDGWSAARSVSAAAAGWSADLCKIQICGERARAAPTATFRSVLVYKCAEPVWLRVVVSITFSLLLCQVMMSATRAHAGHPPASHITQ